MKRIALLILGAVITLNIATAQNVTKNERNEHGVRIIDASMSMAYEDGKPYGLSLSYHEVSGVENYYLLLAIPEVSSAFNILTDQQILFKTSEGNKCMGLAVADANVQVGAAAGRVIRSAAVMYVLSADSVALMASEGIAKIRINYTVDGKETFFDVETSEGNFTKYFKKAYKNISKTIPLPVDKDRSEF